jgi:acyl-homoserine-lactone acylase
MQRTLKAVFLVVVTLVGIFWPNGAAAVSSLDGEVLAKRVTIRRDSYGVPHILGETEEAASFGLGYAQAEDHAEEIARRFIGGRGENAKYFGTSLESDLLIKRFNNAAAVKEGYQKLSPLLQRIIAAYVAGVNRYITQHRAELPSWIPQFVPEDALASSRTGSMRSLVDPATIRQLRARHEPGAVSLNRGDEDEGSTRDIDEGSNAFALAPSRTTSRKAILLGNPHLTWSSLYWEAHVTVPGRIDFFGSTLVGIPVLRAGFNEHLGWVTTNNSPDLADIYALKLDPQNPDSYIFEGKSLKLWTREVSAEVKGEDGTLKTEKRTYWESDLGPVIYRNATMAFAVRSSALESFGLYEGFYRLSRTKSLREWLDVINLNLLPTSNYTYADAAGNILYLWSGRVPKRVDDGTDYSLDVAAEDGKHLWFGIHPVVDLPRLLNPTGGYVQNCNNPPWFASLRDPINPKKYPSYFERGELGLRPQVALEMLESQPRFSFEQVREMKYNTKMLVADRVKPDLVSALKGAPQPSEELLKGLDALEKWDNRVAADSRGAVLFQRFWDQYRNEVKQPFATPWNALNPGRTPNGLADKEKAVRVFVDAVKWTRSTYGSEAVAWGEVHRFRFKDIDLPADGATGTYGLFRVVSFRQQDDGKRVAGVAAGSDALVGSGDAWVLAVEFSKPVKAYSVLAYGQTTNPQSPHSTDQIRLFSNHSYKKVWFTESEIKAHLERSYRP